MMVCLIWYHIYRVDFDLITGNSFTHRYLVTWVFCHVPAPGTWYQVPWSLNTKIYTTKDSSKQVHVNLLQIWGKTTDEFGFITVAFIISIVANTIYMAYSTRYRYHSFINRSDTYRYLRRKSDEKEHKITQIHVKCHVWLL